MIKKKINMCYSNLKTSYKQKKSKNLKINELDILRLLSGDADAELESKIKDWISESDANKAEFKLYEAIWNETPNVLAVKDFDLDVEWEALENKMNASDNSTKTSSNSSPIIPIDANKATISDNIIPLRRRILAAASIILLCCIALSIMYEKPEEEALVEIKYVPQIDKSFVPQPHLTTDPNQVLPDNSVVTLTEGTSLKYNDDFATAPERIIHLSGEAYVKAAEDKNRPMIIKTVNAGIKVLGTEFKVSVEGITSTVAHESGKVLFFNLKNIENQQELDKKGQVAIMEGDKKIDFRDVVKPPPAPKGKIVKLSELVDFLSWEYPESIVWGPGSEPADITGDIQIELEKDLDYVINQIKERGQIAFMKRNGVYHIGSINTAK